MSRTGTFGIVGRLYVITAALVAILAATAVMGSIKLDEIVQIAEETQSHRVAQLQRIAAIELNVTRVSLQLRHAILSRTPQELQATFQDVQAKRALLGELVAEYGLQLKSADAASRIAEIEKLSAAFWKVGEQNIQLIRDGRKEEAFAFLVDSTIPARNTLLGVLATNVKFQEERLRADLSRVSQDAMAVKWALLPLVAIITLGLLAFAWYLASTLRGRVARSCAVAERVRDGDLTQDIVDRRRDEFTPLLSALSAMQQSLITVVDGVRDHAEGVATASAEIAQGNADLSHRTEQQASAVQQTAAAMDQLSATVQQNAANAGEANTHANAARAVAERGGVAVGEVVVTMKSISESSKKIADIIGVIDGIAFQTNILALNAAVEAARAGEQGRGFAVVAGEVRTLAGRSAEASKEIRGLIQESVARVEQGAQLVDRAGATMQEMVDSIHKVTEVVGQISNASTEQGHGVSQVGLAITHIDEATQQNAALVEESAAAAASLDLQAKELVASVAVFQTRKSAMHTPASAPPARPKKPLRRLPANLKPA
ncbi:methyl-accepting chemotaxis protein [Pseudorhodoferax sp. Leaf265]|uniref:methyl-accepting chemotaxis protein n=1 Tax=Pseudorhodoferax sp. Leaf265 TaxID=1736315 RepID=UPI0006F6BEE9|nr:methyl-accepting chemotaxis protein [Pseudorhodoferax sp. Leaf265]KQP02141.1 chemotaxis protein [Pseudorhodoferax sp. Leaf265]